MHVSLASKLPTAGPLNWMIIVIMTAAYWRVNVLAAWGRARCAHAGPCEACREGPCPAIVSLIWHGCVPLRGACTPPVLGGNWPWVGGL